MFEGIFLSSLAKKVEQKDGHSWDSIPVEIENCSQCGERQTLSLNFSS